MVDILGGGNAGVSATDLIKDVTEETFMQDVVDASMDVPVIVDFWAPWCGPCKTLGPMLEAAVTKAKGTVKMAKVNVDENQRLTAALAQQGLPLQSLPTVVAFYQGRPLDLFQGAQPQSEIDAFLKRIAEAAGSTADGGLSEALETAKARLREDVAPYSDDRYFADDINAASALIASGELVAGLDLPGVA